MILKHPSSPLLLTCLLLICCGYHHSGLPVKNQQEPVVTAAPAAMQTKTFVLEDFYRSLPALDSRVQRIYDSLAIKERAAQMIMEATSEADPELSYTRARQLVADTMIGGLLLLRGRKAVFARQIRELDSAAAGRPASRLLFSCDCEPALFHRKLTGAEVFKASSGLQQLVEVEEAATKIASILGGMGMQINFAPVTDIALNKKAISNRSFGNNPQEIISKSVAFVALTQKQQIAACVKHFPGHGAVEGDTHKGQVVINGALSELSTFKSVISQSGPVMVMVGHMTVKNNARYSTAGKPCSVSSSIITQLLKTDLGYKGIVVTDAMRMRALDATPQADWKAVEAGADLVLMPRNARGLNEKICHALRNDANLSSQLEASIKKIIRLKLCCGKIQ